MGVLFNEKSCDELKDSAEKLVTKDPENECHKKLRKDLQQDFDGHVAAGPFYSRAEVDKHLGTTKWMACPRFPCIQPRPKVVDNQVIWQEKVRSIDNCKRTGVNTATRMSEKMKCESIDTIAGKIQKADSYKGKHERIAGVATDMRRAHRQMPVRPGGRRAVVTCQWCPERGMPVYSVIYAHCFGASAAVQNYNIVAEAIVYIPRHLGIPVSHFFDDFWVIERESTIRSAEKVLQKLFEQLGLVLEQGKTQFSNDGEDANQIILLGGMFNLDEFLLDVPEEKRLARVEETRRVIATNRLSPAEAGKLRGKILFLVPLLYGMSNRRELSALAYRQYEHNVRKENALSERLVEALNKLLKALEKAKAREIPFENQGEKQVRAWTEYNGPTEYYNGPTEYYRSKSNLVPEKRTKNKKKTMLGELEAILEAIEAWGPRTKGSQWTLWTDHKGAYQCLCKGHSRIQKASERIQKIYERVQEWELELLWELVEGDSNPAGWPSKGCEPNLGTF